nr:hypothetical protein HK105_007322 [Polyrhizophydium stewartii]
MLWANGPRRLPGVLAHLARRGVRARGLQVAVVGAGPAGFYTASQLLKNPDLRVDVFEQLPVPYGLVRYGVAPDHPDVKNVIQKFASLAESPAFRLIGNVTVGVDVALADLRAAYDAVVLCYGARGERKLGIPGEDSVSNSFSSRAFVGWYNGDPQHADLPVDLTCTDTAVVVGQGNVALDIARILLMPIDELAKTDIAKHALDTLAVSRIRRVHIVGRRGPVHAAFTSKELREMLALPTARLVADAAWLATQTSLYSDLLKKDRARRRLMELLLKGASNASVSHAESLKRWSLDFLLSPRGLVLDKSGGAIAGVEFEMNALSGEGLEQRAIGTGELKQIAAGLLVSSVGYQNRAIEGVRVDSKLGHIAHSRGRVDGEAALYVAGWIKTGPRGVIASTMYEAFETAESLLEDASCSTRTA